MEFVRLTMGKGLARIVSRWCEDNLGPRVDEPADDGMVSDALLPRLLARDGDTFTLRVLTLNTWGIPIAPLCFARHEAMARALFAENAGRWDVFTFQEVWHVRERRVLVDAARKHGLAHHHYFENGCGFPFWRGQVGTGLLVVSRYPIERALYRRFTVTGKVFMLHEADYLGAKGCGLVRVATPAGPVDVVTTHLLSDYSGKPTTDADGYHALRVAEAFELAQFCAHAAATAPLLVVTGDFNVGPGTLALRLARALAGLTDAALPIRDPAGLRNQETYGATNNCFSCDDDAERMDYVLFRGAATKSSAAAPVARDFSGGGGAGGGGAGGGGGRLLFQLGDVDVGWELGTKKAEKRMQFAALPGGADYNGGGASGNKVPLSDHWAVEASFVATARARGGGAGGGGTAAGSNAAGRRLLGMLGQSVAPGARQKSKGAGRGDWKAEMAQRLDDEGAADAASRALELLAEAAALVRVQEKKSARTQLGHYNRAAAALGVLAAVVACAVVAPWALGAAAAGYVPAATPGRVAALAALCVLLPLWAAAEYHLAQFPLGTEVQALREILREMALVRRRARLALLERDADSSSADDDA